MFASALFRMTRPPLIVGGVAMLWGFIKSVFSHGPRYEDREFRKFLHRYQWACLIKGKHRATIELNERQGEVAQTNRAKSAGAAESSGQLLRP
jgi:hypothetical protein